MLIVVGPDSPASVRKGLLLWEPGPVPKPERCWEPGPGFLGDVEIYLDLPSLCIISA